MRFLKITFFLFFIFTSKVVSQTLPLQKRQIYLIDSIEVIGLKSFNPQTVISYSGLRKGQTIQFPGDQVSSVINKLWNLDLFSDINFCFTISKRNNYRKSLLLPTFHIISYKC